MLTLARFVLEKFGGDTLDDVRASLDALPRRGSRRRPRRRSRAVGRPGPRPARSAAAPCRGHGLTGTDEAGSGGDD